VKTTAVGIIITFRQKTLLFLYCRELFKLGLVDFFQFSNFLFELGFRMAAIFSDFFNCLPGSFS
jgi:hypothetical protein